VQIDRIAALLKPYLASSPNPRHSESSRRLSEEPAVLSPAQLEDISTYIDLLLRWNSRMNLTAIRYEEEIVTRHFGESIFAALYLFSNIASGAGVTLADVGSGAGFPGIPIKIWTPQVNLTLIESNQKKSTFLREVSRALTFPDIDIQNARAESITLTFDVVTLRAVERFAEILPIATRLVAAEGRIALLMGRSQADQAQSLLPGFSWKQPALVPESKSRCLLVGENMVGN
jgi:16S rRNA (guanine527-N7)-methyltransferase